VASVVRPSSKPRAKAHPLVAGADPDVHAELMEELKDFARGPRKRFTARHRGEGEAGDQMRSVGESRSRGMALSEESPQVLTSQLLTLSSANVSSQLRRSCNNIIALSASERNFSEKEILLKRLRELIELEVKTVQSEIDTKKKMMKSIRSRHKEEMEKLVSKHQTELTVLSEKHRKVLVENEEDFKMRIKKVRSDLDYLETELRHLSVPVQLLSSLMPSTSNTFSSCSPRSPGSTLMQDMSEELVCCSCAVICLPPAKIYQCPQGDILCSHCALGDALGQCPECRSELEGHLSRNKVLETIATNFYANN